MNSHKTHKGSITQPPCPSLKPPKWGESQMMSYLWAMAAWEECQGGIFPMVLGGRWVDVAFFWRTEQRTSVRRRLACPKRSMSFVGRWQTLVALGPSHVLAGLYWSGGCASMSMYFTGLYYIESAPLNCVSKLSTANGDAPLDKQILGACALEAGGSEFYPCWHRHPKRPWHEHKWQPWSPGEPWVCTVKSYYKRLGYTPGSPRVLSSWYFCLAVWSLWEGAACGSRGERTSPSRKAATVIRQLSFHLGFVMYMKGQGYEIKWKKNGRELNSYHSWGRILFVPGLAERHLNS